MALELLHGEDFDYMKVELNFFAFFPYADFDAEEVFVDCSLLLFFF